MAHDAPEGARSAAWSEVRAVAESARQSLESFDPESDPPSVPVEKGVGPIISVYVELRREEQELTEVERSLLAGLLNDWLGAYAACHGVGFEGSYTVREVALRYAEHGSLQETVRELVDL